MATPEKRGPEQAGGFPPAQSGVDPCSGLPLPDPYPDYLPCPYCGELDVEVWSNQTRARCHNCGGWFDHDLPLASQDSPSRPTG